MESSANGMDCHSIPFIGLNTLSGNHRGPLEVVLSRRQWHHFDDGSVAYQPTEGNVPPCHLLVLDIDGTLVDSTRLHRETLRRSIEKASLVNRDTEWSTYRERTDSGIFAEAHERSFGAQPSAKECRAFEHLFEREYSEACVALPSLMPGAASLLARAASSPSWRVVFATGSFRGPAAHKLGLLRCLDPLLVTASEYRSRRDIVSNAVAAGWAGLSDEARGIAICVGDGVWDARTARELGLPFVGVARGDEAPALHELGALAVLPDCRGIWGRLTDVLNRCEVVREGVKE